MKIKKKIISGLLTATTLVSLCAFSAGAVSTYNILLNKRCIFD